MTGSESNGHDHQPQTKPTGYYGQPVIHAPHWKWLIIGYFFFGGIAGSTAAIASLARLFGGSTAQPVARRATYLSAVALAPCPIFLILDLGRPARFLNMLRTVRPTSPMSIGTWILAAFSGLTAVTTGLQILLDIAARRNGRGIGVTRRLLRCLAVPAAASGLSLAGYTGVLLAATAVPLWSKRPQVLGPLFLASAMASGVAAVSLTTALVEPDNSDNRERLHRLEGWCSLFESGLLLTWIVSLGSTAKPLRTGLTGYVARNGVAVVGLAAPALLNALAGRLPRRARRRATVLASLMSLAGVVALRYVVVVGGQESANDPGATFGVAA